MLIDFNHHSTSYRSYSSTSPCTSSDTASSSYSTASTSCGPSTSTSATSASPCPPPCPDDYEIETDLLVAVCAIRDDSSHHDSSHHQAPEISMSKREIWMHWQDNAAHLEIGQKNMDKCSKLLKRKQDLDEREAKRIRRKERKIKKKVEEGKEERKYYSFMANVNATTRIQAPMDDWECDLEGWSTTIGTVDSASVSGREDNIWKSQPVKEEVPVPVEPVVPLPTITPIPVITQDKQLCEIRHVPGKGLGVIATTNISQGQAIVTESPFLIVDHPPNLHQVKSRLGKLPTDLQNLFHTFNPSLSPHHTDKIVDVIATNVIPLGDEPLINLDDEILPLDADGEVEQRCRSGLFKTICRVNHSCTPNSRWTWFDAGHMSKSISIHFYPKMSSYRY
jgi:hypothetical protein